MHDAFGSLYSAPLPWSSPGVGQPVHAGSAAEIDQKAAVALQQLLGSYTESLSLEVRAAQ